MGFTRARFCIKLALQGFLACRGFLQLLIEQGHGWTHVVRAANHIDPVTHIGQFLFQPRNLGCKCSSLVRCFRHACAGTGQFAIQVNGSLARAHQFGLQRFGATVCLVCSRALGLNGEAQLGNVRVLQGADS